MSEGSADSGSQGRRFGHLWDAHAARVQAYATRQVGADQAEEIVAETFLVAWRRLADVPGDPLPWLLVVARNTIASDRRSRYRARAVEQELARLDHVSRSGNAADVVSVERDATLRALASLTSRQREALLLVSWDGLSVEQAALVARCSPATFRVRLHRARQRLRRADDDASLPELSSPPHRGVPSTVKASKGTTA